MMPESLTSALTQLALAALPVATLLVTGFLVPLLRAHVSAQHWATATDMATRTVRMVEQTQEGAAAESKFVSAATRLRTIAADKGIKLSDTDVHTLVEASVNDLRVALAAVNAPPLPALTPENQPVEPLPATVPAPEPPPVAVAPKPVRRAAPKAKAVKETTV